MLTGKTILNSFPYWIIIIYSTTCYLLYVDNIDYLQVFFMAIYTILIAFTYEFRKEDLFIYSIIFFQLLSIAVSTVFEIKSFGYGIMFMMSFLYYKDRVQKGIIKLSSMAELLKYIVYAYAIVQASQIICVSLGIPPLNYASYENEIRFNGLSSEPSHTAKICLILIVVYMYLFNIRKRRDYSFKNIYTRDKWLWLAYSFVLLTSTSATAILTFPFTFLFFVKPKTFFIFVPFIVLISFLCVIYIDIPAFLRIRELAPVLLSLDPDVIRIVDNSGSARINPFLYYFEDFDVFSVKYWFGFGRGYSEPMLIERVLGHATDKTTGAGGLFPVFFYDYGLITGISFLVLLCYFCFSKKYIMLFFIWVFFISFGSFNSYYQWLFICLSYSCKYWDGKNDNASLKRLFLILSYINLNKKCKSMYNNKVNLNTEKNISVC